MKNSKAKQALPILVLTVVVLIAVSVLSFTHDITKAAIAEQKDNKVKNMLKEMFPSIENYKYEDNLYTISSQDDIIGYAFLASGQGYGGEIEILVGLEDENTVKSIIIISQTETPGIGARITEKSFTSQFVNLPIDDIALSRDGGKIDALTGATISSNATVNAVRETSIEKVRLIKEVP
ncbi:MAG: RnfABCDGE type electron transport complex subunit G [Dehalococcoidia bacterium]|nr:RnfABCDGE type electron transport complex subunit G [Dehalococcoidia bacterium]